MRARGEYDETTIERLKPCPFCGRNLEEFPIFMVVPPVHTDEYLKWKLAQGHFLGSDNYFVARCIQCGAQGRRGYKREDAIRY